MQSGKEKKEKKMLDLTADFSCIYLSLLDLSSYLNLEERYAII